MVLVNKTPRSRSFRHCALLLIPLMSSSGNLSIWLLLSMIARRYSSGSKNPGGYCQLGPKEKATLRTRYRVSRHRDSFLADTLSLRNIYLMSISATNLYGMVSGHYTTFGGEVYLDRVT